MVAQSTYTERMRKAVPGLKSGFTEYVNKTGIVETAEGIPFGRAVSWGNTDTKGDKATILGGTLAKFRGVSERDTSLRVPMNSADVDKYLETNNISIITGGEVWVVNKAAVKPGDPVHFDTATGEFSNTGGIGPIKGAEWLDTAAINTIARISLPNLSKYNALDDAVA